MAGEQSGAVRRLVKDDTGKLKGFGFIKGHDGKDYFFHRSALSGVKLEELGEGENVRFVPGEAGDKGERADRVWLA